MEKKCVKIEMYRFKKRRSQSGSNTMASRIDRACNPRVQSKTPIISPGLSWTILVLASPSAVALDICSKTITLRDFAEVYVTVS